MERKWAKEAAWHRKVYKIFTFNGRRDNGEAERLDKILDGRTFPEWVREKMKEDENKSG